MFESNDEMDQQPSRSSTLERLGPNDRGNVERVRASLVNRGNNSKAAPPSNVAEKYRRDLQEQ